MAFIQPGWTRTLLWGSITTVCYLGIFAYADDLIRFAHTTTHACVVGEGADALYYNKPTPEACAEKGGTLIEGNGWLVLVPILIAFAISFFHGAFTGHFWDAIGLRAATKKK